MSFRSLSGRSFDSGSVGDSSSTQLLFGTTPSANLFHLWAVGVGAVIDGNFFGWQPCLAGGFGGACVSLVIITVFYIILSLCIAELAAQYPKAGGPFIYVSEVLGTHYGCLTGLAELLKLVACNAAGVFALSSYLIELTHSDSRWHPLWWVALFVLFTGLNIIGVKLSFNVELFFTASSLAVLIVFYIGAIIKFDFNKWVLGNCEGSNSTCAEEWMFPNGVTGVMQSLSFSLWFYLGIEELPLITEETINPTSTMPIGIISSISTLVILAFSTLLFSSSIEPGAHAISTDPTPLLTGYRSVFKGESWVDYVSWVVTVGIIASTNSFIFCTGQFIYAISREGYLPKVFSKKGQRSGTPTAALTLASILSLMIVTSLYFIVKDENGVESALINLSLLGALVSYVLQLVSHIKLRFNVVVQTSTDTYQSPFGVTGTLVAILLCFLAYTSIVMEGLNNISQSYTIYSVVGGILYYVIGMGAYFLKPIVINKLNHHRRTTSIQSGF